MCFGTWNFHRIQIQPCTFTFWVILKSYISPPSAVVFLEYFWYWSWSNLTVKFQNCTNSRHFLLMGSILKVCFLSQLSEKRSREMMWIDVEKFKSNCVNPSRLGNSMLLVCCLFFGILVMGINLWNRLRLAEILKNFTLFDKQASSMAFSWTQEFSAQMWENLRIKKKFHKRT